MTWEIYDPTYVSNNNVAQAKHPSTIAGKVVGLFDNTKDKADVILEMLGEELLNKYSVKEIYAKRGIHYSRAMTPEMIDDMATKCDVVVCALGA